MPCALGCSPAFSLQNPTELLRPVVLNKVKTSDSSSIFTFLDSRHLFVCLLSPQFSYPPSLKMPGKVFFGSQFVGLNVNFLGTNPSIGICA
jgi:hypothetical protein